MAITSKNALFAGSNGGGRTCATLATLLSTAKLNGLDPLAWLTPTLERITAGWPTVRSTTSCPGTRSQPEPAPLTA